MKLRVSRGGFTLVELGFVLAAVVLLILILLPALGRPRVNSRHLKDQTQVRGILQGLVVWAQNGSDNYPLASILDRMNNTVSEEGAAKDTTANIMSVLVYNGFVPVEMFVSPAESNPKIDVMQDYRTKRPAAAVNPDKALWDPAFSADFTSPKGGNISYGHLLPGGERRKRWANTFTSTEVAIGNRGPEIASATYDESGTPRPVLANPQSNTLLIHGSRHRWEGQVGYNDNHVDFALQPWAEGVTYTTADRKNRGDVFFYDEPDDPGQANAYLGIFIKAGPERKDFQAIWD